MRKGRSGNAESEQLIDFEINPSILSLSTTSSAPLLSKHEACVRAGDRRFCRGVGEGQVVVMVARWVGGWVGGWVMMKRRGMGGGKEAWPDERFFLSYSFSSRYVSTSFYPVPKATP
jgi:hypothetical protein